jgi:hypothetical protein
MDQFPPPQPPDLTLQLPRDLYYQAIHELCAGLPPPVTASPEDRSRRDNAAIAVVASLLPANGDEVILATQIVAANAQAMECLRLARLYPGDPNYVLKCTAQSANMMRQARAARSLLLRVQSERRKREADGVALGKAAWVEHCAVGLMALALGRAPPEPMAEPEPMVEPEPAPEPEPDGEAEQYALIYPRRAALIRSLGGLPDRCDFGPPEPDLVRAIVTGTSATLRALDTEAVT